MKKKVTMKRKVFKGMFKHGELYFIEKDCGTIHFSLDDWEQKEIRITVEMLDD